MEIFDDRGDDDDDDHGHTAHPPPNPGSIGFTTFTFEFVCGKKFWF